MQVSVRIFGSVHLGFAGMVVSMHIRCSFAARKSILNFKPHVKSGVGFLRRMMFRYDSRLRMSWGYCYRYYYNHVNYCCPC